MKAKNIVISLVIAVVFVSSLVLYQKWAIAKEVNLQHAVFANTEIPPRTLITEDMLMVSEVAGNAIPPNAVSNPEDIIGKYTSDGYGVVRHSLLLQDKFISEDELPDASILALQDDEEAFPLLVDLETSLGNSILPETKVDLYFRTTETERDEDGVTREKPIFGKLSSHVRVVSAKDTRAINVFNETENQSAYNNQSEEARALTKLFIFAVSNEQNAILNKGKMIGDIIPVATGLSYDDLGTQLGEEDLIKYIEEKSFSLEQEEQEVQEQDILAQLDQLEQDEEENNPNN